MDHAQAAEMIEPVALNGHRENGHRENGEAPEPAEAKRELDRSLVYEILREFRALSARDE